MRKQIEFIYCIPNQDLDLIEKLDHAIKDNSACELYVLNADKVLQIKDIYFKLQANLNKRSKLMHLDFKIGVRGYKEDLELKDICEQVDKYIDDSITNIPEFVSKNKAFFLQMDSIYQKALKPPYNE